MPSLELCYHFVHFAGTLAPLNLHVLYVGWLHATFSAVRAEVVKLQAQVAARDHRVDLLERELGLGGAQEGCRFGPPCRR